MADLFDEIVYTDEDVIHFENGIPGFEGHKDFIILNVPGYEPFEWLISTKTTKLRFAVINPLLFKADYNPSITKEHIEGLQLAKPEDVIMYAIVTISKVASETTANLMGPVIINKTQRLGKQIILEDGRYSLKERILK